MSLHNPTVCNKISVGDGVGGSVFGVGGLAGEKPPSPMDRSACALPTWGPAPMGF